MNDGQEAERWQQRAQAARERFSELSRHRETTQTECAVAAREVEVLKRRPSNIPADMLDLRADIAQALQIPGERAVLLGAVGHLNAARLTGPRLVYYRVGPREAPSTRAVDPHSLYRKLRIQPGDYAGWLETEIRQRYDYTCAESMQALRNAERAVTRAGQVRHGKARHEKDDRRDLDDPRHWVRGFTNQEKLERYTRLAHDLVEKLKQIDTDIKAVTDEEAQRNERAMACQTLANIQWQEIDLAPLADRIAALVRQLELALAENTPHGHERRQRARLPRKVASPGN